LNGFFDQPQQNVLPQVAGLGRAGVAEQPEVQDPQRERVRRFRQLISTLATRLRLTRENSSAVSAPRGWLAQVESGSWTR